MRFTQLLTFLTPLVLSAPALAFPVTVENCGRILTFDKAPTHAVVHDLNMSEMAFALDLQPNMAGVTGVTGWYKTTPAFDDAKGDIPELAPKYPTMENLLAADADFFFAGWYYGIEAGRRGDARYARGQGHQDLCPDRKLCPGRQVAPQGLHGPAL